MHWASKLAAVFCSLGSQLAQRSVADIGCFCRSSPASILLGTERFSFLENIFTTCARSMLPQRRPHDLGVNNVHMAQSGFPGCFCYHYQKTLLFHWALSWQSSSILLESTCPAGGARGRALKTFYTLFFNLFVIKRAYI